MVPEKMEMEHTTCIVYGFMPCTVWITCAIFFLSGQLFSAQPKVPVHQDICDQQLCQVSESFSSLEDFCPTLNSQY
jgi:hypothetical protein